jgi:hypothetical protein
MGMKGRHFFSPPFYVLMERISSGYFSLTETKYFLSWILHSPSALGPVDSQELFSYNLSWGF